MKTSMYVYLAVGCAFFGIILVYGMLLLCLYLQIDISQNMWVMAIPILVAIAVNIALIEALSRRKSK